jgi:hypothetical protein
MWISGLSQMWESPPAFSSEEQRIWLVSFTEVPLLKREAACYVGIRDFYGLIAAVG